MLKIAIVKDSQNGWEQDNNDKIHQHEDPQVKENLFHHGDQVWQVWADPEIEKGFEKHRESLEYQTNVGDSLHRFVFSPICAHLSDGVDESTPDMALVDDVPFVLDVDEEALLE